jgi:prepilin-type N-terminal cleavage/methylation domain-containing protein
MKSRKRGSELGFTLIEVIITIVVVAILAAMMTAYFGTGITQSSVPIFRLGAAGKLNRILEKITVEYDKIPRWSPDTAYTTASVVIPTPSRRQEPFGYQYKCTVAGTSAATLAAEPGWPIPGTPAGCTNDPPTYTGCTVTDNGVTWYLYAAAPLLRDLQDKIGVTEGQDYTATFGGDSISYRVIQNRFIKFVAGQDVNINSTIADPEYGRYLKVTIGLPLTEANRTDETLTTLFVRR